MLESKAIFSPDKVYRYSLTRVWDRNRPRICFVMLNPSAADETQDDPTIRRCIRFSDSWGHGSIVVVNLFAYRTHDPRILKSASDPVGEDNDAHVSNAILSADKTIVAWGVHAHANEQVRSVLSRVETPYCLGVTKSGAPKHPLYVAGSTKPNSYTSPALR
jgi:hypothetical protein